MRRRVLATSLLSRRDGGRGQQEHYGKAHPESVGEFKSLRKIASWSHLLRPANSERSIRTWRQKWLGSSMRGVMPKNHENVLVVRRTLFDELGAFQGFEPKVDRYLETFLKRENNFFVPRSRAEEDPAFKQIIPYAVFTSGEKILHYVRGAKSGEKRLVSKGSIGIGGHINDNDESLFSFDRDSYRVAVHREIEEELKFEGAYEDRVAGLINDDSTEVGRVHLGVVHVISLRRR